MPGNLSSPTGRNWCRIRFRILCGPGFSTLAVMDVVMKYVVISYKEDHELRCPRGCHREGYIPSDLEIRSLNDFQSLAEYLATRLAECRDTNYLNLVFNSWEAFSFYGEGYYEHATQGVNSIKFCHIQNCEQDLNFDTQDELRALVKSKMASANHKK